MNDEIKEILDYLKDKNDYIEDFGILYTRIHIDNGDLKLLLDYITNLQQENDMLKQGVKDTYDTSQEMLAEKQQEIEKLKAQLYGCDELLENDTRTIEDYKSRLEKAIEYIKNNWYELNTLDIEHCINLGKDIRIDLLNILQNGGNDEK